MITNSYSHFFVALEAFLLHYIHPPPMPACVHALTCRSCALSLLLIETPEGKLKFQMSIFLKKLNFFQSLYRNFKEANSHIDIFL